MPGRGTHGSLSSLPTAVDQSVVRDDDVQGRRRPLREDGEHPTQRLWVLRRRRDDLHPEDVGLGRGPRRRAVGLRREEVAALAGMSTDYYTRLEQARGPHPSTQILSSLARALRLGPDERDHLFRLAAHGTLQRTPLDKHVAPAIVAALQKESEEFWDLWARHEVATRFEDHKTLSHPEFGEIALDCQALPPTGCPQRVRHGASEERDPERIVCAVFDAAGDEVIPPAECFAPELAIHGGVVELLPGPVDHGKPAVVAVPPEPCPLPRALKDDQLHHRPCPGAVVRETEEVSGDMSQP